MTLIDTAEMYAGGAAEQLVAKAIAGRRSEAFLVSKVLSNHATRRETIARCEASLRRLETDRGLEYALLPWCRERTIPVMAYSPIEQGRLVKDRPLRRVAKRQHATPAQVALAWVLRQDGVVAIPKASRLEHVRENRGALELRLTTTDLAELDRAFPPPTKATPLEML